MRRDIQGLRAVAVLLVIADHFLRFPSGGFIGVDVFFVISGFLITGHLIREQERDGRISFRGFYARRIRRILPAALTVTLVTVIAGFITFTAARAQSITEDGIWATLFAANWRFIVTGTDYMRMGDAVSPLQHYWSLSIEEQFYFVWPFVMVVCAWAVAKMRRGNARRTALITIGSLVVLSFAWALIETAAQPTWAYFSTFSRAWELGVGALLALAAPALRHLPDRSRPFLAWSGLALIAGSALLITSETPFPGPWAAPAVIGTAVVIAAGTEGPSRYLWPLTNRVSSYIGDISYSLYLWHWPVYVFASAYLPNTPRRLLLVSFALTAILSVVSYHFIENPFRKARLARSFVKPTVAVVTVASVIFATAAFAPRQTLPAPDIEARTEYPGGALGDLYRGIDKALQAKEWPELTPAIDTIGPADKAPEWVQDGCLAKETNALPDEYANAERCVYGTGDKHAVLIGDSVAISWMPGLRAALPDYTIHVYTMQSCAAVPMEVDFANLNEDECNAFRDWYLDEIEALHPEILIASNVSWQLQDLSPESEALWQERAHGLYSRMGQISEQAFVLQGTPAAKGFDNCAGARSTPSQCFLFLTLAYEAMERLDHLAVEGTGTTYIGTRYWFCNPQNQCPSFQDGTPVIADASHLTAKFSEILGPALRSTLLTAP